MTATTIGEHVPTVARGSAIEFASGLVLSFMTVVKTYPGHPDDPPEVVTVIALEYGAPAGYLK